MPLVSKLIVLVTASIFISACSFKTVYNQLDYLMLDYVDDLVSLDDVLEQKVEQRTLALLGWHRHSQLLEYAAWLREVQPQVGPGLTEQQVMQRIDEVERFWQSLLARLNSEMVELLPLLNQQQQHQLFASLADSNEEFREDYVKLDKQERLENYTDRLLDNYENWLGDLSEPQQRAIEQAARQLRSSAEPRLQRRLQWQQGIYAILQQPVDIRKKKQALQRFLDDFQQSIPAVMQQLRQQNRSVITRLTVDIARRMTTEQQAHFRTVSDDYIRMFTELAQQDD